MSVKVRSSSSIKEFSYNEHSKLLAIKFIGKQIYVYKNVPIEIFNGLKRSDSTGIYFQENIKDKYEYIKHAGEED